jgi:hypothetical protein
MHEQGQIMVPHSAEVLIVNAYIKEEDEDNRRFLADCERWFERPITVLRDEKYGASVDEVWRRERYMKGPLGAPCSSLLKRRLLDAFRLPGDMVIFGYTAEERDRFDDFSERNPTIRMAAPLIDRGLTKNDCLGIVERAGIVLPQAYRDGFENANCKGCPKGGEGYWNRVRRVYPVVFQQRMDRQEEIGPGAYFFRNRDTGERFGLKDLNPTAGRHNEPSPSCSFFCEIAEHDLAFPSGVSCPKEPTP